MSGTIYSGAGAQTGVRAGISSMTVNGEPVDTKGEASYDATTRKFEKIICQDGGIFDKVMPKAGSIEATLLDSATMSMATIGTLQGASVVLVTATGKTVTGNPVTCTECSPVNTEEGTFKVKFEGVVVEDTL